MSHLTAKQIASEVWKETDLEKHDITIAMTLVRATAWLVLARSVYDYKTVYSGNDLRTAMHSVQDHDDVEVWYQHGEWHQLDLD